MKKKKNKMNKLIIFLLIAVLLVIGVYPLCKELFLKKNITKEDIYMDMIDDMNIKGNVSVDEYTIYGRYFNIKGNINITDDNINNAKIILKQDKMEKEYPIVYELNNNNLSFTTSEYINKGILLDDIEIGNYLILLKISTEKDIIYYNLNNNTNYNELEYYTTTKNNLNNKIVIDYINNEYPYMTLECTKIELPQDIYDIVIDAGHGGVDSGAVNGKYKESDFTLSFAKSLMVSLSDLGYKVKLTRDSDYKLKEYGEKSRTGISYETKAKLLLSIHLNSSKYNVGSGGVEVYTAYDDDISFAKNIADNIVNDTSTSYSPNKVNRVSNGVYKRIFTNENIASGKKKSQEEGWEYYNIDNNTTYYYIIRETGGIITKAYVDGRNTDYEKNPYYQYNHGTEAYLLELGYISSSQNLKVIINEKDNYIKALTKSVNDYFNS